MNYYLLLSQVQRVGLERWQYLLFWTPFVVLFVYGMILLYKIQRDVAGIRRRLDSDAKPHNSSKPTITNL